MKPPSKKIPNNVLPATVAEKARREAELAKRLRDNLRRRKAPPRDSTPDEDAG